MVILTPSRPYTTGALTLPITIQLVRSLDMQTLVVGTLLKVEKILIRVTTDADWNWLGGSWADLDASGALYAQAPILQSIHILTTPMVSRSRPAS